MKSFSMFITVALLAASCNDSSKETSTISTTSVDTTSTVATPVKDDTMRIQVPNQECYSLTSTDSVFLKLEKFPNVVTGTLSYTIKEKDRNKGEIDGVMKGDTLLADYKFMSEGVLSTRQVIFLIKNGTATEGYGEMVEKDGRMIFKSTGNINFSNGILLKKVDCPIM